MLINITLHTFISKHYLIQANFKLLTNISNNRRLLDLHNGLALPLLAGPVRSPFHGLKLYQPQPRNMSQTDHQPGTHHPQYPPDIILILNQHEVTQDEDVEGDEDGEELEGPVLFFYEGACGEDSEDDKEGDVGEEGGEGEEGFVEGEGD